MRKPLPIPSETAALTTKDGATTTHGRRYLDSLSGAMRDTQQTVESIVATGFEQSFLLEAPETGDYRVVVNASVPRLIEKVTTRSAAGTATLTVKINSTALGGTANSVSTSEQEQSHATANSLAVGDDIVFTFSSVSSAEKVSVTLSGSVVL